MVNQIDKFYLKNNRIFESLPLHVREQLECGIELRKVKKGTVIYREGSFPKGVYLIRKGKVKIYQTNSDGREQIMYIYTRGEMVGYRPILCNETHPVSATALEECYLRFIPRENFIRALDDFPEFVRLLLCSVASEFSVWMNNISVFAQQPVKARVALGLLILLKKFKIKDRPTEINLSREDLAAYVGTVKETLVRVLQEFKKDRIVEAQGRKIRVLKVAALKEIAGFS